MKKIMSVLLIVAMLMSVAVFSTAAANTKGNYQVSDKPYADVVGDVIGYIGDTDFDGTVSVMDATAIQMWGAQLITLNSDALLLADVDRDGVASVMDATEIQMWGAMLIESSVITHTLYIGEAGDDKPVAASFDYDKIVAYVKANGEYDEDYGDYMVVFSEEDSMDSLGIIYTPSEDSLWIGLTLYDEETLVSRDTSVIAYKADPEFFFITDKYCIDEKSDEPVYDYDFLGYAQFKNGNLVIDEESIDSFEDAKHSYSEVKDEVYDNLVELFKVTNLCID
ncbi:MAG: dockerin type I repeat-containing protein [Ruminococcus sp.]|nr:dockerin type I repeat-containing protein [Ruminococcus sp.]